MPDTRYADMNLPDQRPRGPILASALLAIGAAVALSWALVAAHAAVAPKRPAASVAAASRTCVSAAKRRPRQKGSSARPGASAHSGSTRGGATAGVSARDAGAGLVASTPGSLRTTRSGSAPAARRALASSAARPAAAATVLSHGSGNAKVVALTFDDGPNPTSTPAILKILQAEKIKATFFMVGAMARYHPETARAVAAAGMLIGDHTEHHELLPNVSAEKAAREIRLGEASIRGVTGITPHWFRSPYGGVSAAAQSSAASLGMKTASWDVDAEDWRNPKPASIAAYVVRHVRPGSIVLLHDGGGTSRANTVAALPKIISALKKRGYRFVTLDQL